MHLSMVLDALIFVLVHFLRKVITSQYIPRKCLIITRWKKSTLTVDWVKTRHLHFYQCWILLGSGAFGQGWTTWLMGNWWHWHLEHWHWGHCQHQLGWQDHWHWAHWHWPHCQPCLMVKAKEIGKQNNNSRKIKKSEKGWSASINSHLPCCKSHPQQLVVDVNWTSGVTSSFSSAAAMPKIASWNFMAGGWCHHAHAILHSQHEWGSCVPCHWCCDGHQVGGWPQAPACLASISQGLHGHCSNMGMLGVLLSWGSNCCMPLFT